MLQPEGVLTGAVVQVNMRNLEKHRADTTAELLLGAGGADTTAGLLLRAGGFFVQGQVAFEDAARHSGRWEEGFCISPL